MQKTIFNKDDIIVSTALFKTARRSYRISDIEKIALKRPLLWFSLPIVLGCLAMFGSFDSYLYTHERWLLAIMVFLPVLGWNIASLNVTSKAYTNDIAAIDWLSTLSEARNALDKVIFQNIDKAEALSHTDQEETDNG